MELTHQDDGRAGVFVLKDGAMTMGEASYVWVGSNHIILDHTGVRPQYAGQGLGKRLVDAVVELARNKEISITPQCSYARVLFERDKSYKDVVSVQPSGF